MLFRLFASGVVVASLVGCSSAGAGPTYASCTDAPPAAIHAETAGGAPSQIELYAGTFYWIARTDPTSGAPLSSTALAALTPGAAPRLVASPPVGITQFWVDAGELLFLGGDDALWRAPLDNASPPQKLLASTVSAAAWTKDATTLYGVTDKLLTTSTTTDLTSSITVVAQSLGGTPRTLATWTVPTGGLGEAVYDDGDSVVGIAAGSIFRVAKSDGRFVTRPFGAASVAFDMPPRAGAFFVGTGSVPHLATLALDGTVTDLWPGDLPAFEPFAGGVASDGTAYFSGRVSAAPSTQRPALAVVRPDGRASIVTCTPDMPAATTRVLVGDHDVYLVRGIINSESWEIDRVAR